jgi:hypothetical protein
LIFFSIFLLLYNHNRVLVISSILFVLGAVSVSYHPLNWLIVLPVLVFSLRLIKGWTSKLLLTLLFSGSFLLFIWLLPESQSGQIYTWVKDWNFGIAIDTYLRKIYQTEGSVVEKYVYEFNLSHSLKSFWMFVLTIFSSMEAVVMGFVIMGAWFLLKKRRDLGWLLFFILILTGPILAIIMKFPVRSEVSEIEFFWGMALRWRMFFNFYLFAGIFFGIGLFGIMHYISDKWPKKDKWIIGFIFCIPFLLLISNYKKVDASQSNFGHEFTKKIILDLPENSVLIVDTDLIFTMLAQQIILDLRPDIEIIPVHVNLSPNQDERLISLWGKSYGESPIVGAIDRTILGLQDKRRVFWYAPPPEMEAWMGLEGNPFYATNWGYVTEVSIEPKKPISNYNYGLSKSLSEITGSEDDWWQMGVKTHVASIHARLSYYAARSGDDQAAKAHLDLATALAQSDNSRELIRLSYEEGLEKYLTQSNYLNYKSLTEAEYLNRFESASESANKEYWLTRALLIRRLLKTSDVKIDFSWLNSISTPELRNYAEYISLFD